MRNLVLILFVLVAFVDKPLAEAPSSHLYLVNSSESQFVLSPHEKNQTAVLRFRLFLVANRLEGGGWDFPQLMLQYFTDPVKVPEKMTAQGAVADVSREREIIDRGFYGGHRLLAHHFYISQSPDADGYYHFRFRKAQHYERQENFPHVLSMKIRMPSDDGPTGPLTLLEIDTRVAGVGSRWISSTGFYFDRDGSQDLVKHNDSEDGLFEKIKDPFQAYLDAVLETSSDVAPEHLVRSLFSASGNPSPDQSKSCTRWIVRTPPGRDFPL